MTDYVDGKLYSGLGHWCDFCQCFHSSMSCFHPGRNYTPAELKYKLRVAYLENEIRAAIRKLEGPDMPFRVREVVTELRKVIDED
jgi:hypothetical protein